MPIFITLPNDPWYTKPEWWAIIASSALAIIAILQPYIVPKIKARFWPRRIDIYEALLPDLNFGATGPSIGLCGAFISRNASSLVTRASVRAKRLADGAELTFEAMFNRTRTIVGNTDGTSGEIWRVFQLPADEPSSYDIVFANDEARAAIKDITERLNAEWIRRLVQLIPPPHDDISPANQQRLGTANQAQFRNAAHATLLAATLAEVEAQFYWKAGEYEIVLEVSADRETWMFGHKWRITVTPEMETSLRSNGWRLVQAGCRQPAVIIGQFMTAWPQYQSIGPVGGEHE